MQNPIIASFLQDLGEFLTKYPDVDTNMDLDADQIHMTYKIPCLDGNLIITIKES